MRTEAVLAPRVYFGIKGDPFPEIIPEFFLFCNPLLPSLASGPRLPPPARPARPASQPVPAQAAADANWAAAAMANPDSACHDRVPMANGIEIAADDRPEPVCERAELVLDRCGRGCGREGITSCTWPANTLVRCETACPWRDVRQTHLVDSLERHAVGEVCARLGRGRGGVGIARAEAIAAAQTEVGSTRDGRRGRRQGWQNERARTNKNARALL
jgi:hypothetical protein